MILLSIQVPTTPDRRELYNQLSEEILRQCVELGEEPIEAFPQIGNNPGGWRSEHIEFLYCEDNKELTIGEKRNILYAASTGVYSVQWDSDDFMKNDAIKLIMERIHVGETVYKGDCITYGEYCSIDGQYFLSNHSVFYDGWSGDGQRLLEDGYHYHRTPFFKSVIKTAICQAVQVKPIRFGEDNIWADEIKPLLKTEVHIPEYLYLYNHQSSDHNTRYGIKSENI